MPRSTRPRSEAPGRRSNPGSSTAAIPRAGAWPVASRSVAPGTAWLLGTPEPGGPGDPAGVVGPAGKLVEPPLAGVGGRGPGGDGLLDQVERAGVADDGHLRRGDAPGLLQPGAPDRGMFGQRGADLLHPVARRGERHQVR